MLLELDGLRRVGGAMREFFGNIRPAASFDPADNIWTLTPVCTRNRAGGGPLLVDVLDGVDSAAGKARKPVAVISDESQTDGPAGQVRQRTDCPATRPRPRSALRPQMSIPLPWACRGQRRHGWRRSAVPFNTTFDEFTTCAGMCACREGRARPQSSITLLCRVSGIVAYTTSDAAMHAVTYQ